MTIHVDVTDIKRWPGIHGGIQRVVYEIAKEFYLQEAKNDVSFVAFDNERKIFHEISFDPIIKRVEDSGRENQLTSMQTESQNSLFYRAKRKAKKLAGKSRDSSLLESTVRPVTLKEGDTILILGMSWESSNMQSVLEKLKAGHKLRVVQVVYDLIVSLYPHLHHPANYHPYTKNMIGILKSSDLLLPISKSSASDIKRFARIHKLKTPQIEVIRLGDALSENRAIKPQSKISINQDFILCVGTIEIRKNHTLLYYAYKLAKERGIKLPQLIIVGSPGWFTGDIQYLLSTDLEIRNDILVLNNVEDENLRWLYKNCLFTVYPSIYEGWGLPIAESLTQGKVCIASGTSSMKEIGGNLVEYFSPFSSEELLNAIEKMEDKQYREKKEEEIKLTYKATTWRDTTARVQALMRE